MFGFRDVDRYAEVEGRWGGRDRAVGLERLLQEQGRAAGLAFAGAARQLAAVVVGLLAD